MLTESTAVPTGFLGVRWQAAWGSPGQQSSPAPILLCQGPCKDGFCGIPAYTWMHYTETIRNLFIVYLAKSSRPRSWIEGGFHHLPLHLSPAVAVIFHYSIRSQKPISHNHRFTISVVINHLQMKRDKLTVLYWKSVQARKVRGSSLVLGSLTPWMGSTT